MRCFSRGSFTLTALFCSFCGPLKGSGWECSELFLELHRTFAFCGERCAQVGNTCTDLCAPADSEVQISALSFQPFLLEPSVPGMEVEHLGGFRRGRWMMRRGLHYSAASIAELKSRRLLTF